MNRAKTKIRTIYLEILNKVIRNIMIPTFFKCVTYIETVIPIIKREVDSFTHYELSFIAIDNKDQSVVDQVSFHEVIIQRRTILVIDNLLWLQTQV